MVGIKGQFMKDVRISRRRFCETKSVPEDQEVHREARHSPQRELLLRLSGSSSQTQDSCHEEDRQVCDDRHRPLHAIV